MNKIKLRQIIKNRGWTRRWLAGHLGVDPSLITRMLSGERSITTEYSDKIKKLINNNVKEELMSDKVFRNVKINAKLHEEVKKFCTKRNLVMYGWLESIIGKAIRKTQMLENIENFERTDKDFELVESEEVLPEDPTDAHDRFEE